MARDNRNDARGARAGGQQDPIVIKKYANRRLYNTATSSYVTLDHLCQMVKEDVDFVVYDAKTGEDITRSVLTQIIVEEESKGTNLLPITFLRQLISFYGHSMQGMVPRYLEHMMSAFAANQDRMRQQMQDTMSGMFPFGSNLGEMGRQNAALMESAMKMFSPFPASRSDPDEDQRRSESQAGAVPNGQGETDALAQLKQQVDVLQQQLEQLSRDRAVDRSGTAASEPSKAATPARQGKREQDPS